jgi:hypothetical protein
MENDVVSPKSQQDISTNHLQGMIELPSDMDSSLPASEASVYIVPNPCTPIRRWMALANITEYPSSPGKENSGRDYPFKRPRSNHEEMATSLRHLPNAPV